MAQKNKGKGKDQKGKGSKCANYGDPNIYHKPEDYFATNIKKQ
jgi:hypothetical protein